MAISDMNHFTVLTHDLAATRQFYIGILGLKEGFRPDLGFPGAWLYVGDRAVLHVIAGRPLPEPPGGVLDHMAFSASDLQATVATLKARGIDYTLRKQNESGAWQLFCFAPRGGGVALVVRARPPAPGT